MRLAIGTSFETSAALRATSLGTQTYVGPRGLANLGGSILVRKQWRKRLDRSPRRWQNFMEMRKARSRHRGVGARAAQGHALRRARNEAKAWGTS